MQPPTGAHEAFGLVWDTAQNHYPLRFRIRDLVQGDLHGQYGRLYSVPALPGNGCRGGGSHRLCPYRRAFYLPPLPGSRSSCALCSSSPECSAGVQLWFIFAAIVMLGGAGRSFGLDHYVLPFLGRKWRSIVAGTALPSVRAANRLTRRKSVNTTVRSDYMPQSWSRTPASGCVFFYSQFSISRRYPGNPPDGG